MSDGSLVAVVRVRLLTDIARYIKVPLCAWMRDILQT